MDQPTPPPVPRDLLFRPDLRTLALNRYPVLLHVWPENEPAPIRTAWFLPLWEEKDQKPGVPFEQEAWKLIEFHGGDPGCHAVVIFTASLREPAPPPELPPGRLWIRPMSFEAPVAPICCLHPLFPAGTPKFHESLFFVEMVALCARFSVISSFRYKKAGASAWEDRRGVLLGVKNGLIFTLDADRGGATRSFRADCMDVDSMKLSPGQALPMWGPGGYLATGYSGDVQAEG